MVPISARRCLSAEKENKECCQAWESTCGLCKLKTPEYDIDPKDVKEVQDCRPKKCTYFP